MVDALKRAIGQADHGRHAVLSATPARTRSTAAASRSRARLVADLFKTAGADRLMTVDLHTAQIQGFFDGPVDHLLALPLLADYVEGRSHGDELTRRGRPDAGRVRVAERWTDAARRRPLAIIHKRRDPDRPNEAVAHGSSVRCAAASASRRRHDRHRRHDHQGGRGADGSTARPSVIVAATHAVLSRPGGRPAQELRRSARSSSPTRCRSRPRPHFDTLTVLSIAPLLARAIREVFDDGSVTDLFGGVA